LNDLCDTRDDALCDIKELRKTFKSKGFLTPQQETRKLRAKQSLLVVNAEIPNMCTRWRDMTSKWRISTLNTAKIDSPVQCCYTKCRQSSAHIRLSTRDV
jgi:hypothetical protein